MKSNRSKGRPPDFSGGGDEYSSVSMKSNRSKGRPPDFSGGGEEHSCVSMKSNRSKGRPPDFSGEGEEHSCVSMKSNRSKGRPPDFSGGGEEYSCVSMKSNRSKGRPPDFSGGGEEYSCVSMKSNRSKGRPPDFSGEGEEHSCVSMKSNRSKGRPDFSGEGEEHSCVSMKSNRSKGRPPDFSGGGEELSCISKKSNRSKGRPPDFSGEGEEHSCVSMKSNQSKGRPPDFSGGGEEHSCISKKSNRSKGRPPDFSGGGEEHSCISKKSNRSKGRPPDFSGGGEEHSCISKKSNRSKGRPPDFSGGGEEHSCISKKSNRSKGRPPDFSGEGEEHSCVSMKSNRSKGRPPDFSGEGEEHSCVSMKSNRSKGRPPDFSGGGEEYSCVSMKSNRSKGRPPDFSGGGEEHSCVSMKSNRSKGRPPDFSGGGEEYSCVSMKSNRSKGRPPDFSGEGEEHSCVSMKSNRSKGRPPDFSGEGEEHSCVSMKSNRSKGRPPDFSGGGEEYSCVSMKSNRSKGRPPDFSGEGEEHSCVSMKSNRSKGRPPDFSGGGEEHSCISKKSNRSKGRPPDFSGGGEEHSCVSMKSNRSKGRPPDFSGGGEEHSCISKKSNRSKGRPPDFSGGGEEHSCISKKSNRSKGRPPDFSGGGEELSCISKKSNRSKGRPPDFSGGGEEHSCISKKSNRSKGRPPDFSGGAAPSELHSSEADLNVHTQLGDSGPVQQDLHQPAHNDLLKVIENHKTRMKNKYETLFEGIKSEENKTLLNRIYTQLYIIEGETEGVNKEHEVLQMEKTPRRHIEETPIKCSDIFKPLQDDVRHKERKVDKELRTVLTKGIAGIGKTVSVQKFILDWAEGKANQDVDFMFVLPFRELNLIENDQYSLYELLCVFHPELKDLDPKIFEEHKVVFIFDSLDESRIALNFSNSKQLSKKSVITSTSSISALMTNLFSGELLPSARIWITCRPAAAHKIPSEHISRVTEIQGFNNPQKEEYFRKRLSDQDQAQKIISHIKTTRSLHIMCHIPVFCWISSTVLQEIVKQGRTEIPKTLTEMYSHFLITQVNKKKEKYEGKDETDPEKLLESNRTILLKLAKLAFNQLMKKNVMFYEEDLRECGIDVTEASVYSGVFTEIFREECVIYQRKVYSFVHLSFQEFLAAVYLIHCYETKNMKVLRHFEELGNARKCHYDPYDDSDYDVYYDSSDSERICGSINSEMCYDHSDSESSVDSNSEKNHCRDLIKHVSLNDVLIGAVCKAVKSQNGHLDLFLRFLLGISLESNQRLLQGLLKETHTLSEKVTKFIKRSIKEESEIGSPSTERVISLFLCLSEVNDQSLSREIQEYLQSENQSEKQLSPGQCSALAYTILTSEEVLEELDLKKYNTSKEGYRRLIPAATACRRAVFVDCNFTSYLCSDISSVLESVNSSLKELDLSENELRDDGVEKLSEGLKSSHCKLEKLRLCFCMVTEKGCSYLASALKSNPFYLRELDLSYNHPGESGVKLLSELQEDPQCKLETLRVDHGGEIRLKRGVKKYDCELTLDPNTASRVLSLSDGNRKGKRVEADQPYPDHPDQFERWGQVLSAESLTGRCYWEVKWSGKQRPVIAVSYRGIRRKGQSEHSQFGRNNQSWSLEYLNNSYCVYHNKEKISERYHPHHTERVGVYVDWKAGTLKFYSIFSGKHIMKDLCTVQTTFTEPLYAGFRVFESVCVCKLQ